MLEVLRAWLNGARDYAPGVSLYLQLGDNAALKTLLQKGKTAFCHARLQAELLDIFTQLNHTQNDVTQPVKKPERKKIATNQQQAGQAAANSAPATENANADLYDACKIKADKVYKEAMNVRAVLFSQVPSELYEDPNRPDLVLQRSGIALDVVKLYNKASKLYDEADYVRQNGTMKEFLPEEQEDDLPDHLVKNQLDNLRKNYNKIKKREPTPDRVIAMQKHEEQIKKMEQRWRSLK